MLDDLYILQSSGIMLYSWHSSEQKEDRDSLFSGFLSAIQSFASMERGEDLKSLKLDPSTIVFERLDDLDLLFVMATTNDDFVEILHSALHTVIERFKNKYKADLEREFDGEVGKFESFTQDLRQILQSYGLDSAEKLIQQVDTGEYLKSVFYLEPKGNNILYIHAKQYVNKEKISFIVPLLMSSSKLLYKTNLKEEVRWILLSTSRNEIMLVEPRENILIIKQYELESAFEDRLMGLEFFKEKNKYVKKPKRLANIFEDIDWNKNIRQVYLVDLFGKIFFSEIFDESYDCKEYIPEVISFITSSKKGSEEIYSRTLFYTAIGGSKVSTICLNFNNFALILIGNIHDFSDFKVIQEMSKNIIQQLND